VKRTRYGRLRTRPLRPGKGDPTKILTNDEDVAGPAGLSYLYIPPTACASDSKQHEYYNLSSMSIASSSSTSSSSTDYTTYPLISHNGRTYLRGLQTIPYPPPLRPLRKYIGQSLRSLMLMHVFWRAVLFSSL
ncbi:SAM binding motif containing protein, partial [Coccidioides immitis H538.4]